jgi:hypothetical protein
MSFHIKTVKRNQTPNLQLQQLNLAWAGIQKHLKCRKRVVFLWYSHNIKQLVKLNTSIKSHLIPSLQFQIFNCRETRETEKCISTFPRWKNAREKYKLSLLCPDRGNFIDTHRCKFTHAGIFLWSETPTCRRKVHSPARVQIARRPAYLTIPSAGRLVRRPTNVQLAHILPLKTGTV